MLDGGWLEVLLDEAGTKVHIELYQRRVADHFEAVDLARLDDEDVSGTALERLTIHRPDSTTFADELDLIIGMPMRPGS